jgi:hypothetical protein
MTFTIQHQGLRAQVKRKRIKHLYLRVQPPDGRIQISAPMRVSRAYIKAFLASKQGWIGQRRALIAQQASPVKEYVSGEMHSLWGQEYPLLIIASARSTQITLRNGHIQLRIPVDKSAAARQAAIEKWLRQQLREAAERQIPVWEARMQVRVTRLYIRRMRSLWGSCNPRARSIRINTVLATLHPSFLEYILVHEMVHLLEPSHNRRFYALMDQYLPDWKSRRKSLKNITLP